jgi:all-trans-retinol 13,14-reductase
VEKNPIVGGYVTSFSRKGFQFDTCQMASQISDILDYFGIEIPFQEFEKDFIRVFRIDPETKALKTFELFSGEKTFEEQFFKLFPDESKKLSRLFEYSLKMFHEIYGLKYSPNLSDITKMLLTCPKVIRNSNKTFAQYLKIFKIENPEINLIFQIFSAMCGLPNERIAALLTIGVMYSLREKSYRPSGPFRELPEKMEQRYRELGGELLLKSEVEKIMVEHGNVQGILLKDGSTFRTRHIISAVDIKTTMEGLVGLDIIRSLNSRYVKRLKSIRMTTSSFNVNLGIDDSKILTERGLNCGYELLTSGNNAFSQLYNAFEKNEFGMSRDCFYIGLNCQSRPDRTNPVLTLQAIPVPAGDWINLRNTDRKRYIELKEKTADILIDIVEKNLISGLRKHIVVKDISTPATFARYSGSATGSIFDMESVPENFGANRLPIITPIKGLLVPKFAHGLFGSMNSGLQAVDILLRGQVLHGNSRFKKY